MLIKLRKALPTWVWAFLLKTKTLAMIIDKEVLPTVNRMFEGLIDRSLDRFNKKEIPLEGLDGLNLIERISENIKQEIPTSQWSVVQANGLAIISEMYLDRADEIVEVEHLNHIADCLVGGASKQLN